MKILALDQALQTTGWAVFDNQQLIAHDTFTIPATKPIEQRLGMIWDQLTDLYYQHEFKYVIFEDIQNQNNNQTYCKLAYVQAAIMLWCYFNDMKFTIYPPTHWRSLIGGSWGKKREEQKAHAIELVKQKYNVNCSSDAADAICIGYAYLQEKKNKIITF